MIVELFGSGCEKCQALEDALCRALGLALDGKVVVRGRAPAAAELKELIAAAAERAGG